MAGVMDLIAKIFAILDFLMNILMFLILLGLGIACIVAVAGWDNIQEACGNVKKINRLKNEATETMKTQNENLDQLKASKPDETDPQFPEWEEKVKAAQDNIDLAQMLYDKQVEDYKKYEDVANYMDDFCDSLKKENLHKTIPFALIGVALTMVGITIDYLVLCVCKCCCCSRKKIVLMWIVVGAALIISDIICMIVFVVAFPLKYGIYVWIISLIHRSAVLVITIIYFLIILKS